MAFLPSMVLVNLFNRVCFIMPSLIRMYSQPVYNANIIFCYRFSTEKGYYVITEPKEYAGIPYFYALEGVDWDNPRSQALYQKSITEGDIYTVCFGANKTYNVCL